MKLVAQKKPRKLSNAQILIKKFIDSESFSNSGFWPREMKMASKMIRQYNLEFLMWVIPPYNRKVPSLAYFMADYGKQYLSEQFFNFKKNTLTFPEKPAIITEENKVGEDKIISQKPKTLKDFLNYGKN
jgi:hypothetical protein